MNDIIARKKTNYHFPKSTNVKTNRAAARDVDFRTDFRTRAARGSMCNGLLCTALIALISRVANTFQNFIGPLNLRRKLAVMSSEGLQQRQCLFGVFERLGPALN